MGKAGWRRGELGAIVSVWGGRKDEFGDKRGGKEAVGAVECTSADGPSWVHGAF